MTTEETNPISNRPLREDVQKSFTHERPEPQNSAPTQRETSQQEPQQQQQQQPSTSNNQSDGEN